ncbi:hypothetical protein AYI68_g6122 [Smittium mucronatum]|uniref:Uncharacterized protein n=1 Tax=Smittium mucronatum TaxID=133383 RepID=A0A1R0GSD1_9FUNG|nr:hypothetical protein AYI68_g6122 [Smittium mucronatum]
MHPKLQSPVLNGILQDSVKFSNSVMEFTGQVLKPPTNDGSKLSSRIGPEDFRLVLDAMYRFINFSSNGKSSLVAILVSLLPSSSSL